MLKEVEIISLLSMRSVGDVKLIQRSKCLTKRESCVILSQFCSEFYDRQPKYSYTIRPNRTK